MIKMTLSELASILSTDSTHPDITFTGLSKDTRTLTPGNLYIAIVGENLDGHDYVMNAQKAGAAAALVSRRVDCSLPQIVVKDTLDALGKLAENWRDRFALPLIGVTGSNGKTTLKNMIASILRAACDGNADEVLATEGNLNNNIGLPLMLARLNSNHRYGVLEMGMNHFNEIAYLTKMTKPYIAIVNNAAEAHLQGLKDVAGVAKAKGEIFMGLPQNGIAVLNQDDKFFAYWASLVGGHTYLTFGLENAADVTATFTVSENATCQSIVIKTPKGDIGVELPLLGIHNVMNALAATAATLALGLDLSAIQTGLTEVAAAPGRMNHLLLPNGACVIDDTYNANPFSTAAAIKALSTFSGKKILVLGDMRELGPDANELHATTGEKAHTAGIDFLFTLGELSEAATKSFGKNAFHFTDHAQLVAALAPHVKSGCTVLVKGSRSMKMEKVVAGIVPEEQLTPH
ncbi:MAG: UDP-N-acetylmuramoyl-tripeptide--D-alanyl-D-alanine ligase [Gammaproteobacteria bacterium]|nr:UDP-N-acetylmuramoyl-tripeptide--D-alanyl-D-alanine ligase [Gammaproteobacteria bacterium]